MFFLFIGVINANEFNESDDSKIATDIISSDIELYYKNGTSFEAQLIDNDGNPLANEEIDFFVNNNTYTKLTDSEGIASLAINLNPGSYIITTVFKGNNSYDSKNASNNIIVKETIIGKDIIKIYKNETQYYATFLDSFGNPLKNTNVTFNINGVFYNKTTDSSGIAKLTINLNPKIYILTAIHPDTGLLYSNTITVLSNIISNDLIKDFQDENQYHALFLDSFGNPLKNTEVSFNINGVFYTRITNDSGIAKLNINLYPNNYILTAIHPLTGLMESFTISVLGTTNFNNGYWVWSRDMQNLDLALLRATGAQNIFLNYNAIELYGESAVTKWIAKAASYNIKVHLWIQAFYNGAWINPVNPDGSFKYDLFDEIIQKASNYANIEGLAGIHLDYLRFPGTAYKNPGGTQAINTFVQMLSERVKEINPKLILSAAVMPETNDNVYYYGQDVSVLGQYLDVIIPMVYKGNYKKDTPWITATTDWFVKNSNGAKIWVGIQGYNSDSDTTPLSLNQLFIDTQAALKGGAQGNIIFRFGVSNILDFTKTY